jgi:hypothetical protein
MGFRDGQRGAGGCHRERMGDRRDRLHPGWSVTRAWPGQPHSGRGSFAFRSSNAGAPFWVISVSAMKSPTVTELIGA